MIFGALIGSAQPPQPVDVCRRFIVYGGLYACLRFAAEERHNWPARAA
jgi:hypothetical protein